MVGLLDKFPLVRSADFDRVRLALANLFQDSTFDIAGDRELASCINYCPLQNTGILYGRFGAAISASFGEMRFFVHGVTLRGTGEQLTNGKTTSAKVGGLLSPRARLGLKFDSGFETIALKIEADALAAKLGAMIGTPPTAPLSVHFDPGFRHPAARRLHGLLGFLVGQLSSERQAIPLTALVEMEQGLMTSFLTGNRHNYSHLLEGRTASAAPWQVKRVEEYVEAHWDQPITIEMLAAVTGASGRSLFHSFRQSRGYSPMVFLREVRLRQAWLILNANAAGTSVTDTAFACGFGNLGHFASYFRTKFGEAPSAVLSRAKHHQ